MKKFIPTTEYLTGFCLSLSHLVHAGIGAADSFYLLSEDEKDPALRQLLRTMAQNADGGMSLSESIQAAGVFPGYLCTLLTVGEAVGKTEQTLQRLGSYYENTARLQRQLRSALMYPAVLLIVLLAVLTVLLVWVLPVFDGVYAQLGSGLTGISLWLLNFGRGLGFALPWIGGAVALALVLLAIRPVRKKLLNFWKKHWGDRGVWAAVNRARFVQALSLGISSGMTAQEAVQTASLLANPEIPAFQKRCTQCKDALESGDSLAAALAQAELLPPAEKRLLDAGNRSGQGAQALESIADRLLERSQEQVAGLAEKTEPAAVIFACVLIGLVLLSVMLPLMNIMNTIG